MNEYQVFVNVAREIASERGEFAVFILALREDMTESMVTSVQVGDERWDVIMSAPWLEADRRAPLEYVAEKIRKHGGVQALKRLARLSVVPMSDPIVKRDSSRSADAHDGGRIEPH